MNADKLFDYACVFAMTSAGIALLACAYFILKLAPL